MCIVILCVCVFVLLWNTSGGLVFCVIQSLTKIDNTVVWEKYDVKKFSSLVRQRKLSAQNIFNNKFKSKGNIFDLVLL